MSPRPPKVLSTYIPLSDQKNMNHRKRDELWINFESEQHVKQLLYRLSLADVMKINTLNKDNKIVQDFLKSVFN